VQATRPWSDDTTQTATNTSIPGWYLYHVTAAAEGGANGHQRIRYGAGTTNTGSFWSYGATSATDRALSSLASNTTAAVADGGEQYIGLRLTNTTGRELTSFTLSYTGEEWRDGGTAVPNAQTLTFDYKVGAAALQEAGFSTDVAALTFTSPTFTNTGSGVGLDGNLAANRTVIGPVTVTGINWANGTDLWIRWTDLNDSGNDHGLGIDDLQFSAEVPEPSTITLLVFCATGLVAARRRS